MSDSGFNEGSGSQTADVSDTMSTDSAMSSASTSTLTGPGPSDPHTQLPGEGQMAPPSLDSGRGSSLPHSARSGQTAIPHGRNVERMNVDSGISTGIHGSMDTKMDTSNLLTDRVDTQSRTEQWIENHFDVFVKNLDGKTHTVTVDENEDVSTFRQKVAEKLGVPDAQQRLTTQGGKTLEDGLTLKACNVTKHSTIYCQGRLRGGSETDP